jgi:hypothetical protein
LLGDHVIIHLAAEHRIILAVVYDMHPNSLGRPLVFHHLLLNGRDIARGVSKKFLGVTEHASPVLEESPASGRFESGL